MLQKAISDIYVFHENQKYGDKPYVTHLLDVYNLLIMNNIRNQNILIAALHHDAIEDYNQFNKEEYITKYNKEIYAIIYSCTGNGKNRTERTEDILNKIKDSQEAILVKMADRICNMKESFNNVKLRKLYLSEFDKYNSIFKLSDYKNVYALFLNTYKQLRDHKIQNAQSLNVAYE